MGDKERVVEVRDREDFVHTKRRTRGRAALLERLNKNKKERNTQDSSEVQPKATPESTTEDKPKKKKKRKIVKKD